MKECIEDGRAVTTLFVVFIVGLIIMYIHELRTANITLVERNAELQTKIEEQQKTLDTIVYYYNVTKNTPVYKR